MPTRCSRTHLQDCHTYQIWGDTHICTLSIVTCFHKTDCVIVRNFQWRLRRKVPR